MEKGYGEGWKRDTEGGIKGWKMGGKGVEGWKRNGGMEKGGKMDGGKDKGMKYDGKWMAKCWKMA